MWARNASSGGGREKREEKKSKSWNCWYIFCKGIEICIPLPQAAPVSFPLFKHLVPIDASSPHASFSLGFFGSFLARCSCPFTKAESAIINLNCHFQFRVVLVGWNARRNTPLTYIMYDMIAWLFCGGVVCHEFRSSACLE